MNDNANNTNTLEDKIEMTISDVEIGTVDLHEGYYPVVFHTNRGDVECRYYASATVRRAVIFVGSEKGGWDTPVHDMLYPSLCNDLARHGMNCLRVKYREPGNFGECILDILAAVSFLNYDNIGSIGLVGHSFGGAAAIQVAAATPSISTVVSLSPQMFGSHAVDHFRHNQSILVMYGTDDMRQSVESSSTLFRYAHDPKKIIYYKGARHNLDEAAPEVFRTVKEWLYDKV